MMSCSPTTEQKEEGKLFTTTPAFTGRQLMRHTLPSILVGKNQGKKKLLTDAELSFAQLTLV